MFAFLKRAARAEFATRSAQFARTEIADIRPGWTDSASDLFKGTEIVEYSGDFAATVFLEHFSEQAPAEAGPR